MITNDKGNIMKPNKIDLTQEQLMGMFDYDSGKGLLLRRCFSSGLFTGRKAVGSPGKSGYRYVEILGVTYLEHRLIWIYLKGTCPVDQLDHINKNRCDNRIENLRETDNSGNQRNTRLRKSNKTGIMGVHARSDNNKWSVRINHSGRRYSLGSFSDFFEACCARKSAELRFGYDINHGISL